MCLILFAWQAHPDYPLIVAANRDEFYARPTEPAHLWPDTDPPLLAGRDLQAGGTWMGVTADGRFAAVTNYREVPAIQSAGSRGQLVTDFLTGNQTARRYAEALFDAGSEYAGFNLLVGDGNELMYVSNRDSKAITVEPGIHGLSNASLDTPWPKVNNGREQLEKSLSQQPAHAELQALLTDESLAMDQQLPDTGIPHQLEKALSATKIVLPDYGTRCSTTLMIDTNGNIDFMEQRYQPGGQSDGRNRIRLTQQATSADEA